MRPEREPEFLTTSYLTLLIKVGPRNFPNLGRLRMLNISRGDNIAIARYPCPVSDEILSIEVVRLSVMYAGSVKS